MKASIVRSFDCSAPTHAVVVVNENRMVASRTEKYFEAILRRLWIVSEDWITRSHAAGEWLAEEDFEIRGDCTTPPALCGAQRARLGAPPVFAGRCFAVGTLGPGSVRPSTLSHFLLLGGAVVDQERGIPVFDPEVGAVPGGVPVSEILDAMSRYEFVALGDAL